MELKEIQEIIKAENIDTLRVEYPDLNGICRHKVMPVKHLEAVVEEGLAFAQAIYAIHLSNDVAPETGCGYEIEWKDMTIVPDLNTFAVLPYLDGTARLIGNAFRQGQPIPVDPRFALQRVLKKYEEKNLRPVCASELEFFLFKIKVGNRLWIKVSSKNWKCLFISYNNTACCLFKNKELLIRNISTKGCF